MKSPQQEFDELYITSMEVCRKLEVSRATVVMARRRGDLPEAIEIQRESGVPYLLLWKRAEAQPAIDAWAAKLKTWREARTA
jgi:hypothetical protein